MASNDARSGLPMTRLRRTRVLLAAGLMIGCLLSGGASAGEIGQFRVAGWFGTVQVSDKTHQFQGCAVFMFYRNGITLYFLTGPSLRWEMDLEGKEWRLKRGDSYPLSYAVDGGQSIESTAVAHSGQLVSIEIPNNPAIIAEIKGGHVLHFSLAGDDLAFDLAGAGQAMDAATDCTRQRMAGGTQSTSSNPFAATQSTQGEGTAPLPARGQAAVAQSTNPFVPGAQATTSRDPAQATTSGATSMQSLNPFAPPQSAPAALSDAGPTRDARFAEATAFVSNLLSLSDLPDVVILDRKKNRSIMPAYDAIWTVQDVLGGLIVVPFASTTGVDTYITKTVTDLKTSCKGTFSSHQPPVAAAAKNYVLRRLVAACDTPGQDYEGYYTIFARPGGGVYLQSVVSDKRSDGVSKAQKVDSKILAAALRQNPAQATQQ